MFVRWEAVSYYVRRPSSYFIDNFITVSYNTFSMNYKAVFTFPIYQGA